QTIKQQWSQAERPGTQTSSHMQAQEKSSADVRRRAPPVANVSDPDKKHHAQVSPDGTPSSIKGSLQGGSTASGSASGSAHPPQKTQEADEEDKDGQRNHKRSKRKKTTKHPVGVPPPPPALLDAQEGIQPESDGLRHRINI